MTWVKQDDQLHRNPKQLSMSDAAYRLWTLSWSYCADTPLPNGFLSTQEAVTFARSHGKSKKVIDEVVAKGGWERVSDGFLVHDFDMHVSKSSTARVRDWRARKRAGNADVTGNETVSSSLPHARVGPVPVPDPVPGPVRASKQEHQSPQSASSPSGDLALSGELSVDPVQRLFSAWATATGRKRTALTPARRRLVKDRQREGFSLDDLELVVTAGWQNDPWNERPLHNEFEVLLRNARQVETFLKYAKDGPPVIEPPMSALEISGRRHLAAAVASRERGE